MEAKLWQTVLTAAFQFVTYEQIQMLIFKLLLGDKYLVCTHKDHSAIHSFSNYRLPLSYNIYIHVYINRLVLRLSFILSSFLLSFLYHRIPELAQSRPEQSHKAMTSFSLSLCLSLSFSLCGCECVCLDLFVSPFLLSLPLVLSSSPHIYLASSTLFFLWTERRFVRSESISYWNVE